MKKMFRFEDLEIWKEAMRICAASRVADFEKIHNVYFPVQTVGKKIHNVYFPVQTVGKKIHNVFFPMQTVGKKIHNVFFPVQTAQQLKMNVIK
ncbi:MAG: hypothetical protein LBT49_04155 [Prevotellaceae bacterium]|jgi:hypothetical protein|nr:hypothetical protein [Prevotellaceae bacterium]